MFAADAAAVLDYLGLEGAVVCGHSMGGRVAQLLALEYPRNAGKLILASSCAAHPGETGIPLRIAKEMVEMGYEKYVGSIPSWSVGRRLMLGNTWTSSKNICRFE